jgi:hypothetical protein
MLAAMLGAALAKPHLLATLLVAAVVSHALYVTVTVLGLGPEERLGFIPDDTYYYLSVARHRAQDGIWTFDGVAPTTGFHPMHAYGLAAAFSIVSPGEEGFATLCVGYTATLALSLAIVVGLMAHRRRDTVALLLLALFLGSRNVLINVLGGTEWALVVSVSALYTFLLLRSTRTRGRGPVVCIFLVGWAGSWARADFGLLAAAMASAAILELILHKQVYRLLVAALAGLGGACMGVLSLFFHNYLISGQFVQSSARMKSLWLQHYGLSTDPVVDKILLLFGPPNFLTKLLALLLILLVIGIAVTRLWRQEGEHSSSHRAGVRSLRVVWLGSGLTVLGYVALYALNPAGLQHWYTATVLVSVFAFLSLPFASGESPRAAVTSATAMLALLACLQLPTTVGFRSAPEWPYQVFMFKAGKYLRGAGITNVGSWNSGIIGYYQGGDVINLDGLVNDEIYEYAKAEQLSRYIDERGIRYIVDFEKMLTSDVHRHRGGYDDPDFVSRLIPIERFDPVTEGWSGMALYRLEPLGL